MRARLTFASLLALALFGLASRPAHAQSSCSADSDCVKGWTCQVSGGAGCTAPACAPGEKCEPQASDCASVEFKSCQPAPCQSDSDCAEDMVCYTHTETNCAPSACASGQECPAPSCEPKTESACLPRYVLPCTAASDCGAGFQCESAGQLCACSGGASAGGSDNASDGATPPSDAPEQSCTCEPSKELRCHAESVTCSQDSDCTAGWSCVAVAAPSNCASTPAPAPEPNPERDVPSDGALPPDCAPAAEVKLCVPPHYRLIQGARDVVYDSAGSGSPASGANDANEGAAAIPPAAENGIDYATPSGGCSVGHGSNTGSALAVLGALGLFGALRRRRAH